MAPLERFQFAVQQDCSEVDCDDIWELIVNAAGMQFEKFQSGLKVKVYSCA